jgi:acyl-CoA synthetase (AMP-forming)/AMP-acid ligase II
MLYTLRVCSFFMDELYQLTIFAGSTGKPKGVDVSHGNVTNALLLEPANLGITIGSKVAQVLNIAFDMGAWEILACLMNGGTLHLRGSSWEETLSEVSISSNMNNMFANESRSTHSYQHPPSCPSIDAIASPTSKPSSPVANLVLNRELPIIFRSIRITLMKS